MVRNCDSSGVLHRDERTRLGAWIKVGSFLVYAVFSSKKRKKNRKFFDQIVFFLKICYNASDWSTIFDRSGHICFESADWRRDGFPEVSGIFSVENVFRVSIFEGKSKFLRFCTRLVTVCQVHTDSQGRRPHRGCCIPRFVFVCFERGTPKKGNTYLNQNNCILCAKGCDSGFLAKMVGDRKSNNFTKDPAKSDKGPNVTAPKEKRKSVVKPALPVSTMSTRSTERSKSSLEIVTDVKTKKSEDKAAKVTDKNANVEASEEKEVFFKSAKTPTMADQLKAKADDVEAGEEDEDDTMDDFNGYEINQKVLLDTYGLNQEQKVRIIGLLTTGELIMEPDMNIPTKIPAEHLEKIKLANKTYTIRIKFANIGVKPEEEAARPGDDVVQGFLFFEEGLGLPFECLAQKFGAFNQDKKSRLVTKKDGSTEVFPEGRSQLWEIKVVTWIPLNLDLVVGQKTFEVGTGKDKWRVILPGATRQVDEKVVYCHGICEDPTIHNETIADKIIKLGINVQGGRKGVKTSNESRGAASKMTSAKKFFFSNNEFKKNDDGEYDKLSIGVYSQNLKKNVSIRFSIRDEAMRTKAVEAMNKKCMACGNDKPKCNGVDGVFCDWKEISLDEYKETVRRLQKLDTMITGAEAPKAIPSDEDQAVAAVIQYMIRIRADTNEERAWRVRSFAAYTMKLEAERAGKKAVQDQDGFTEVKAKTIVKKLRFTNHQPFKPDIIRMLDKYGGSTDNKDRLLATIYRWPSKAYDFDRAKALAAELNVCQLRELVVRTGVLATLNDGVVKDTDEMKDKKARALRMAKWLDSFVMENEELICRPEEK